MAANGSAEANRPTHLEDLLSLYVKFELAEGICLSVMSVLTVSANVLLLIAVWKDPETVDCTGELSIRFCQHSPSLPKRV